MGGRRNARHPFLLLGQEVLVIIVQIGEIILRSGLAAERGAVGELLDVVQATRDAAVAVRVVGVKVDRRPADDARVELRGVKDRLLVRVDDAGLAGAVGVDEIRVLIGVIALAVLVAVTQRDLDILQCRDGLAAALELALAFLVGGLDRGADLLDGHGVGLRDDQRNGILRGTAAERRLGLVDIQIGHDSVFAGDDLARIFDSVTHDN